MEVVWQVILIYPAYSISKTTITCLLTPILLKFVALRDLFPLKFTIFTIVAIFHVTGTNRLKSLEAAQTLCFLKSYNLKVNISQTAT